LIPLSTPKAIGVDPGFSSSRFAIVVSQLTQRPPPASGSVVEVIHAEEFEHADFNQMITEIVSIYRNFQNVANIYIDGSSAVTITPLKQALGELRANGDYHEELRRLKAKGRNPAQYMKVLPVSFREESREMLAHTKRLLDAGALAISPTLNKLVVAMRTAYGIEGTLKKKTGEYDDSLDALMLSLKHFGLPSASSSSAQVLVPPPPQPFVIRLGR
jgi:hypothetical protein